MALAAACSGPPGAGLLRGEDLGDFRIDASQQSNDCGAGALGEAQEFDFQVQLSSLPPEFFWDARAAGRLSGDDFSVETRLRVTVREARGETAGCSVSRLDTITGTLERDDEGAVVALSGAMTYAFGSGPAAECSAADIVEAGLERLPCAMSYALAGLRSRAPERPAE